MVALPYFLNTEDPIRVTCRPTDTLPNYIKGNAWFYKVLKGYKNQRGYIIQTRNPTTGHNQNLPIEFIKD